jgi:choline dehydrogenase-like flavoprotein
MRCAHCHRLNLTIRGNALVRLREAYGLAAELLRHEAFKGMIAARIAPTDQDLASDAALDGWQMQTAGNAHHTSGTCKMEPVSDHMAVVDQYCRVHGSQGWEVADASIMPYVTRSNTNATTICLRNVSPIGCSVSRAALNMRSLTQQHHTITGEL